MKNIVTTATALSAILSVSAAFASPVPTVSSVAKPGSVSRGGHGTLTMTVSVPAGYHVNANKIADPYLIPTVLSVKPASGITLGAPKYPKPASVANPAGGSNLMVYKGKVAIVVPFTVSKSAKPGRVPLESTLKYQMCNDKSCFPPSSAVAKSAVTVK